MITKNHFYLVVQSALR